MSALDALRSFAESRERDSVVIRDGIRYGDARAILKEIERLRGDLATSEAGIESLKDRFAAAVGRGLRVTVLERENDELRARLRIAVDLLEEIANAKAGEAIFWGKAELIVKVQACQDLRTRFGLQDDARALVEKIKGELR